MTFHNTPKLPNGKNDGIYISALGQSKHTHHSQLLMHPITAGSTEGAKQAGSATCRAYSSILSPFLRPNLNSLHAPTFTPSSLAPLNPTKCCLSITFILTGLLQ